MNKSIKNNNMSKIKMYKTRNTSKSNFTYSLVIIREESYDFFKC